MRANTKGHDMTTDVIHHCDHPSFTGAERSIEEMGRFPVLWKCDECGALEVHQ